MIREDGVPVETLSRRPGRPGRPLRTTLSTEVQQAAEEALGDRKDEAAVVAVEASTGDILAVANRPADSSYDRASKAAIRPAPPSRSSPRRRSCATA